MRITDISPTGPKARLGVVSSIQAHYAPDSVFLAPDCTPYHLW